VKAVDILGWLSSIVLLVTLGTQVRKQWISRQSEGVSRWLFLGQLAASCGFSLYSYLLGNWVYLATNLLLVINALLGQWVTLQNRKRAKRREPGEPAASARP
jgi:MtN3 and saliva related transmembrane protein